MGKIRTKIIGLEDVEKKQKEEAKKRQEIKKTKNKEPEKNINPKETVKPQTSKPVQKKSKEKTHVRGKNYLKAKNQIKKENLDLNNALRLLKKIKYAKFDETVEIHINTDETGLKGEADIPHGTGKKLRVAIIDDKLLEQIAKGKIDFDMLVAHPSFMPKLAKYAKLLGPKGLMPNPKAGTISTNPEATVKKFEKGLLRWKTEAKAPLIHQAIGKISFEDKALLENIESFVKSVGRNHIRGVYLKTSMSPAIKLDLKEV